MNANRIAALTGAGFVLLYIASFVITGEPPDATEDSAQEIVDFYVDNDSSVMAGTFVGAFGLVSLLFFGGYLRKLFEAAAGPGHLLPKVVQAGTIVLVAGAAFDLTVNLALAEAADDIDPVGVQTLNALWNNDFVPMAVGGLAFILASGLSILRHGALPKWLGWVAIVLAVAMATPAGFVGFLGMGVWILVVSIMQAVKEPAAA